MQDVPYGYCHCGCGEPTAIAAETSRRDGYVKGEPRRFISGHNPRRPVAERFWEKVDRRGDDECWEWTASTDPYGYGSFRVDGRSVPAHRFAYEFLVGAIPDGKQLDHLCRNHGCVNPRHLEPVTQKDNILRGISPPAMNATRTHCKNGHPLSGPNLYIHTGGGRRCRECNRIWQRERAART